MQRCCTKLGSPLLSSSRRLLLLLSPPPSNIHSAVEFSINRPIPKPFYGFPHLLGLGFRSPFPHIQVMQARNFAKERSRAPDTPITSKVKKYKLKAYSSFKSRFRTMHDGNIRRWRAGKRHNAHQKSKKSKRRLRKPAIVHAAYAKVMKKLNFCG